MNSLSLALLIIVSLATASCSSDPIFPNRVQYLCSDGGIGQCSIITGQYIRP